MCCWLLANFEYLILCSLKVLLCGRSGKFSFEAGWHSLSPYARQKHAPAGLRATAHTSGTSDSHPPSRKNLAQRQSESSHAPQSAEKVLFMCLSLGSSKATLSRSSAVSTSTPTQKATSNSNGTGCGGVQCRFCDLSSWFINVCLSLLIFSSVQVTLKMATMSSRVG